METKKTKTNPNDPIAPLRAISDGQAAAPVLDKDGKKLNKNPEEQKKPTTTPEQDAKKWSDRFEVAKSYQLPLFQKWSNWYDAMYAHVTNPAMAPWRSKVYMPIIASKVWDLISRFIQYRPGWDVAIRTLPVNTLDKAQFDLYMEAMTKNVEKVKMKLEYDYDCPLMEDSIPDELLGVMLDAAVTGQGVGRVPYLNRTTDYKQYDNSSGTVNYSKVQNSQAVEGYNSFSGINIFNFFLKPGARSLQTSPWVIIADQVPLYTLKKDPKYDQAKLAQLKAGSLTNEFAQYEASRNRLVQTADTSSLDTTTQMVQIYECWDKETNENIIYGIGNSGWVEIFRGQNIYWHKKYPMVPFYIRRKPYQFWGESLFENSETLQAAINDIFNHFMDGYNMADGMIAIEEGSVVEPYVIEPGGEIRYRGELPKQFKFPAPDATGMQTALNLINGAIENATISQYASGVPNSATDQTQGTATGVTRMMEAAAEKVGFMRSNFRRSWREVGQMWLSNTQQFMTTDVVYEKTERGEKTYEILRPSDMLGIFGVKIDDGSFEPVSKDQKRQDFLTYVTNLQSWQKSSLEQFQWSQDPSDRLRIDWNEVMARGSEQFSENSSHFTLPSVAPITQPQMSETPAPAAPAPEMIQPMSAEEAGMFAEQSDGKSMPDSFPVRNIQSLAPML